jgi:transposase
VFRSLYGCSRPVGRAAPARPQAEPQRHSLDRAHGAPWRDLPPELGKWSSVHRQFRRRTALGLWDLLLQALAGGGGNADLLRMIDSTLMRAHHCAAGARGGTMG